MASKSNTQEAPKTTVKKRGKKLEMRAPFVKYETGMVIDGTIALFTRSASAKFGDRDVVQIRLNSPLTWAPSKNAKDQSRLSAEPGDVVSLEVKPGLAGIKALPEGTDVQIEVVGQVDTGKGNPAWSFEVTYD